MTTDRHTPCPVCSILVRQLVAEARAVLHALESNPEGPLLLIDPAGVITEAAARLAFIAEQLTPFVDAHLANQDHALSPELEGLRQAGVLKMLADSGAS